MDPPASRELRSAADKTATNLFIGLSRLIQIKTNFYANESPFFEFFEIFSLKLSSKLTVNFNEIAVGCTSS
jgi:hypothetical protein